MRRAGLLFVLCLASIGFADDKKSIAELFQAMDKAMMAKDTKALMRLCAKDFTAKQNGQVYTAAQIRAQMDTQFKTIKKVDSVKTTVTSLKIDRERAAAATSFVYVGTIVGADGKPHKMVFKGSSKDSLVKVSGKWLFKSTELVSEKGTLDGKPIGEPPKKK